MDKSKTCTKCKQLKSITEFHKHSKAPDGLQWNCIDCKRISNRVSAAKRRKNDPQKHRDVNKKSRLANLDGYRQRRRERYLKNKEKENAAARKYYAKNPEIHRAAATLRNRRREINGIYKILDSELKQLYSTPCYICGSDKNIEADHRVPISKGGKHSIGNLIPLCKTCNRAKSDKYLFVFLTQRRKHGWLAS